MKRYIVDMNQERSERENMNQTYPYTEPTAARTSAFYESCLIVPIESQTLMDTLIPKEIGYVDCVSWRSIGLICADGTRENLFDAEYDLALMRQLAIHAFCCYRTYLTLATMVEGGDHYSI